VQLSHPGVLVQHFARTHARCVLPHFGRSELGFDDVLGHQRSRLRAGGCPEAFCCDAQPRAVAPHRIALCSRRPWSRATSPSASFDSGVGGLTVLRALQARLPNEATIYLGDTARVPYGTRSQAVVTRYALANARFLFERQIKLLVVACNTVSAESLPSVQAALPVPVIGVVVPGAAGRRRRGAWPKRRCDRHARDHRLRRLSTASSRDSPRRSRSSHAPVRCSSRSRKKAGRKVTSLIASRSTILAPFRADGVGTLVLGCTHYPLLSCRHHAGLARCRSGGLGRVDSDRGDRGAAPPGSPLESCARGARRLRDGPAVELPPRGRAIPRPSAVTSRTGGRERVAPPQPPKRGQSATS